MSEIMVVYNEFWTEKTLERLTMERQLSDELLNVLSELAARVGLEHLSEIRSVIREVDQLKRSLETTASILRQYQADMERGIRRIQEKISDAEGAKSTFLSVRGHNTKFMS